MRCQARVARDAPVEVRESAPSTTPPSNSTAMIDVPVDTPPGMMKPACLWEDKEDCESMWSKMCGAERLRDGQI